MQGVEMKQQGQGQQHVVVLLVVLTTEDHCKERSALKGHAGNQSCKGAVEAWSSWWCVAVLRVWLTF